MDRPRHPSHPRNRRRDPQRTGPIRNAGEAFRDAEPRRSSARSWDDTASRGVREGYRVIDEQIRRGQRMAQAIGDEPWSDDRYDPERGRRPGYEPRYERGYEPRCEEDDWRREGGGGSRFLEMPMRHVERLAREILRQISSGRPDPWRLAELILRLQIEAVSELARLGFSALGGFTHRSGDSFEEDVERVGRDIDETFEEIEDEIWEEEEAEGEPWEWPPAPSTPTVIRSTVPIPVYVSSYEQTEIDLDLPAGSQSLELEVEPLLVSGTDHPVPPTPVFEAGFVVLGDGPAILRIEVPRDLPAGRYRRRILIRATDEPVGDLTVQVGIVPVGTVPVAAPPTPSPKKRKKR